MGLGIEETCKLNGVVTIERKRTGLPSTLEVRLALRFVPALYEAYSYTLSCVSPRCMNNPG